jgi:hypothetical protein
MNFELLKKEMFKVISTKEITLLRELDNRITLNKSGKFLFYNCLELDSNNV